MSSTFLKRRMETWMRVPRRTIAMRTVTIDQVGVSGKDLSIVAMSGGEVLVCSFNGRGGRGGA